MRTLTLLLIAFGVLAAQAQQNALPPRQATLGAGLEIGIPRGSFDDSWGREIVGVSGNFALPMRRLPFDWGFDFAFGGMGSDRKVVAVNNQYLTATTGDLRVTSSIFGYHGLIRLKPFNGKVSPYIEGLAGIRHFVTSSTVRVEGLSEAVSKERNESSLSWSAGWAVGVQVAPTRLFYVEGRVERLNGTRVTYVDPRSIVIDQSGQVNYTTLNSGTSVVNVHLGVGLRF
jgi:hypothetical protein